MTTRNRPPDHLPDQVRDHPEVIKACQARDVGKLFRLINNLTDGPARFTQSHLGRRCEMTPSQVAAYMADKRRTISLPVIFRISDGLQIPGGRFGLSDRPWETTNQLANAPVRIWKRQQARVERDPDATESDEMNRRELLRALSVVGALVVLPPEVGTSLGRPSVSPADLDEHEQLNSYLWKVFSLSQSKRAVYPIVRHHLDLLTATLQRPQTETMHNRLCMLTSDLFQLAGEIFFDSNRYTDAAHCYTLAASASKEARAYDLWACALTRHAFIGIYEHSLRETVPMLSAASKLAQRGDPELSTRHWVAAVQGELYAGLGDLDACNRAIEAAEEVNSLTGKVHNGGWLRFDGSRLSEQRGSCYTQLGCAEQAEDALNIALMQSISARRRGSVLTDLALLGFQQHDLDKVLKYGQAALDLAERTSSAWVGRKLQDMQSRLAPIAADTRIAELNRQINMLNSSIL